MATVTSISTTGSAKDLRPRIIVFGVGGAGGNAINNMISARLDGVSFVAANTDAQALERTRANVTIQLGPEVTEGLGSGARPELGAEAAEASDAEIRACLEDAHMVFITAGMGGGTGTGASPVVARIARDMGVLTVAVVTKPFEFEGPRRMAVAEDGLEELAECVDTLIVIPNQNLFRVIDPKTPIAETFALADEVLHSGVRGVTDLITRPGIINLDFADVRTVMQEMGSAMMGTGEATGDNRAVEAAHAAVTNPLLDEISLRGARGVLINVTGGADLTLHDVEGAANEIRNEADPDAVVIVGSAVDDTLDRGEIRVSVLAAGIDMNREMLVPSVFDAPVERPAQRPVERAPRDEAVRIAEPESEERSGGFLGLGRKRKDAKREERKTAETTRAQTAEDEDPESAASKDDENDLDIPAFLRRQAG